MRRFATLALCVGIGLAAAPVPESAGAESLSEELGSLLDATRWADARWGVLVVSMDRGDTLFAREAHVPLAPASNVKLLTTAAAMVALGADYRFRTYALSDAPIESGTLQGDLVVYGTGDPGLSSRFYPDRDAPLDSIAVQLRAQGIHTIDGDLVGDVSFLPGPLRPEGWDPRDLNDHFAAPASALSYNENVVSLWVEAASTPGARPTVNTLPDHAGLDVVNLATTVAGRPRPRLRIERDDPLGPIRIEGAIQRGGRDIWRQMTVSDPPRYALSVLRAVLADHGITVRGGMRVVEDRTDSLLGSDEVYAPWREERPPVRVLATLVSPPLREYLEIVNKRSHNLLAELIFRTLGRVQEGDAGTEASARAVRTILSGLGADLGSSVQLDGSGLSSGNRVSAGQFIEVLAAMGRSAHWQDFWETLPEAGTRGELTRMYQTSAAGNLRAKTGTIENVSALTGVVHSAEGERLAFSIMVNNAPSTGRAKGIENAIGTRLAEFTRADEPD